MININSHPLLKKIYDLSQMMEETLPPSLEETNLVTKNGIILEDVNNLLDENKKFRDIANEVYTFANIAVNQIICLGGRETCQPCENREQLAIALDKFKKIID